MDNFHCHGTYVQKDKTKQALYWINNNNNQFCFYCMWADIGFIKKITPKMSPLLVKFFIPSFFHILEITSSFNIVLIIQKKH